MVLHYTYLSSFSRRGIYCGYKNTSAPGQVPEPLPAAPVSTASQHQQRLSLASSHRPPPPPQPQSQPQPRPQPQSALQSPQQVPPRVNGTLTGSAAAPQVIFGPSATAQQITQDRWNRLEPIFQHVRSQAVNYEFPGATLSALEMVSRHILLGVWSGFYRRRLVVNTDVTGDPWNRHRPVATLGLHARSPIPIYPSQQSPKLLLHHPPTLSIPFRSILLA